MDIIVSFSGGPLDGDVMASDAADPIERRKAQLFAKVIGGCLHDAEKREVTFKPGLTYTITEKRTESPRFSCNSSAVGDCERRGIGRKTEY